MTATSPQEHYLADKPVATLVQDEFKRYGFAKRIAETIRDRKDPDSFVVGLYGRWGEGKSSVLNFITTELKASQVATITFNPWRFEGEDQLLIGFFTELALALNKQLKTSTEKFGDLLARYADVVVPKLGFLGGAVSTEPGAHLKKIGELMAGTSLTELKARLDAMLRDTGKRVVIVIDDIDRLNKQEIQAIFRLVKLTADFSHTTYLLSFDDTMVARAIGEMYAGGDAETAGRNFLEKIVQVPIVLPVIQRDAMHEYCMAKITQSIFNTSVPLSGDQWEIFNVVMLTSILDRITTPRHVVRYSNSLSFILPLLRGEANALDLVLIEALKVFYPELYHLIARHQAHVTGAVNQYSTVMRIDGKQGEAFYERLRQVITSYLDFADGASVLVSHLFPRVNEKLGQLPITSSSRTDEQLYRAKSIASDSYFRRYFSYAVQKGEISEQSLNKLRGLLEEELTTNAYDLAAQLLSSGSGQSLLRMLAHHLEDVTSQPEMHEWIRLLSHFSKSFHHEYTAGIRMRTDLALAVTITLALLARLEHYKRRTDVMYIVIHSSSYAYSFELVYRLWQKMQSGKGQQAPELLPFDSAEFQDISRELIVRTLREAGDKPLFAVHPYEARHILLTLWKHSSYGAIHAQQYLQERVTAHPEEILGFLTTFAPLVYSGTQAHRGNFSRSTYDFVGQTFNLEYLHEAARNYIGPEKISEYPIQEEGMPDEQMIIRQFIHLHENPKSRAPEDDVS